MGAPKKLTETSAVSRDFQIREEMTKLTDGNGHITDFLRTQTSQLLNENDRWDHWERKNHDRICSDHFEGGISIF